MKQGSGAAADFAQDKAKDLKDTAKDFSFKAEQAKDTAAQKFQENKDLTAKFADKQAREIKDKAADFSNKAADLKDQAASKIQGAGEELSQKTEQAKDSAASGWE